MKQLLRIVGMAAAGFALSTAITYMDVFTIPDAYTSVHTGPFDAYLSYLPGLIFGLLLGYYIYIVQKPAAWKVLVFTFLSTISYFIAFISGSLAVFPYIIFHLLPNPDNYWIVITIEGGLGTAALIFSYNLLFIRLRRFKTIVLIALGAFLSLSSLHKLDSNHVLLFIVWQTGMAAVLAWAIPISLPKGKKKN
jgi:hypothetical protein